MLVTLLSPCGKTEKLENSEETLQEETEYQETEHGDESFKNWI
jgi:hypothetical protein